MKTKQLFSALLLFCLIAFLQPLAAQNAKETKSKIGALLESRNFIFRAQTANPMRGNMVQLTSPYDMMVSTDSIKTYLPFFGRAYSAPMNTAEGGIKITSTDFEYNLADKRKKRWNIAIIPNDTPAIQQLTLSVSEGGYATLRVLSTNRDPITFNGYVTARE